MKIGGPLRGMKRSVRISLQYLPPYFVVGAPLLLALRGILGEDASVQGSFALLFVHCWVSVLIIFPSAIAANFALARVFPRRTWRNEPWRPWSACGWMVVVGLGGIPFLGHLPSRPPPFLRDFLGGWAESVHLLGWMVFLSNLGLLLAWLIPSRRGRDGG